jgi:hypothetical protein
MRKEVTMVVVTILIIASLAIGYLAGNNATRAETITSTLTSVGTSTLTSRQTITSVATSTVITPLVVGAAAIAIGSNGNSGLNLVLALNATTLNVGQSLNVDVSLFNARPSVNVVYDSADSPWGVPGRGNFSGIPVLLGGSRCGDAGPVLRAVVLQGNYTAQQLPSAANSTLTWGCSGGATLQYMTFGPDSSMANITETYYPPTNETLPPTSMSISFTTQGYWNLTSIVPYESPVICPSCTTSLPVATPYIPGVYTVAVSDDWGQVALLHVTVQDWE